MLTLTQMVMIGVEMLLLFIWIFFYIKGYGEAELFQNLEEKEYPLKDIYFVGYAVMTMMGYSYKSKSDRKLRREMEILYGKKYAEYYVRVIYAQKVTISFTLLAMAIPLYLAAGDIAAMGIAVMFAAVAYYYFGTVTEKRIFARSEELLGDFSEVVSKLALLTNAGMILKEAWEVVSKTGESTIYTEMQLSVDEMNNGVAEVDAYYRFGVRCMIPEIKKFTSTIVQGMLNGSEELEGMLRQQSGEVWAAKRQSVRRQGEKASGKLLIPMMIMFIGILIMVLIPIFTNIGV
ncbi:MAG: pilus assembly protein TadC [Lachnospiraceae bacterium]|nr:pilus assembly protein TadC [Lachnospiraceae bacterium]